MKMKTEKIEVQDDCGNKEFIYKQTPLAPDLSPNRQAQAQARYFSQHNNKINRINDLQFEEVIPGGIRKLNRVRASK